MSHAACVLPQVVGPRPGLAVPRRLSRLRQGRLPWLPAWGVLLAGLLIFSRRPDAILHAQFWAEDGSIFFADVYQHGLLATLLVPQSGYFQEFPVLVAGLEQLIPLHVAPLVGNVIAILVRSLPVGLLLSERARTIAPSLRTRALLAALYVCLPGVAETDANVVNSLWYLAIAAVIVIVSAPPRGAGEKVLDGVILCLCATTGVFAIALAPLLYAFRRWRGHDAVARWVLALFSGAAATQLLAIGYLQHHLAAGYNAAPRVAVPLHPSISLFLEIVGRRVVMQPLCLEASPISPLAVALIGLVGVLAVAVAIRRGGPETRLFLSFACALLVMALAHPYGVSWADMTSPPSAARYFLIPEYAIAVVIVCLAGATSILAQRVGVLILLAVWVIAVPWQWSYPPLADHGFTAQALAFEKAPLGARMVFPLDPLEPAGIRPWEMTLVRR